MILNVNFESIVESVKTYLEANPIVFYAIVGGLGILVLLIVVLSIAKAANKKKNVDEHQKLIEETLAEEKKAKEEALAAQEEKTEPVVEEVQEEPVVEEAPVEEVQEEPVVEEAPVEEVQEAPVKKAPKKRAKKVESPVEEQPVAEEVQPVAEEVQPEAVEEEKPAETKKQRVVNGKYEVYTDGTSYYYTLKASNGEILIKSEAYASKDSVLLAIEAIKRNVEVGSIAVREDKHGLYQFVLTARNHRTLVMSANYSTEKRAQSASESFKRFAATSPVIELTEIVESSKEEVKIENIVDKKGGKLIILSNENGYYYVLKASNGEVLVTSDNYKTEASAQSAMARFQEAVVSGKFYVEKDKRDNYQFKLFAPNGRIVCVGQIYASKSMAIASVNSVCSFIKLATVVEE